MNIAQTIIDQLAGNRFIAMTGAKMLVSLQPENGDRGGVQFRIGKGAKDAINSVRITLTASDTYRMEFFSIRGLNVKLKAEFSDVYASQLRQVFAQATGFDCTL